MKSYGVNELRKMYLDFFESKDHLVVASAPLIPRNDNSLLLINSGMAPLKPYFTGQEIPPRKRMASCQKCIRTGDIENAGKTARHGTFFEMLGNFSFGEYFKKEAIAWTWEFLTKTLEIPKELLYVSVYEEDDEAEKIWHEQEKVPMNHIVRMGKKDNFWEHGIGPCGPCSEVYYDRGEKYGCGEADCKVGCECDRFVEIWNNVFTQFDKTTDGQYLRLEFPNIDTGMGLERLAVAMQDVASIFEIDTIKALLDTVCQIAGVSYGKNVKTDISIRVITDHVRSITFMTSDGVLPSNEGRGYVLRRLLRRAARHGKLLGINQLFLANLSKVVIETSKDAYPELAEKQDYILKILSVEEERFYETIDSGLTILKTYMDELEAQGEKELSGEKAFKLYDTYGFPFDLTFEILEEKNMTVDEVAFKSEMNSQRKRARDAREESTFMGSKETIYNQLDLSFNSQFVGYSQLNHSAAIKAITTETEIVKRSELGQRVSLFFEETPFYATSGGQATDIGLISTSTGEVEINDVIKVVGGKIAHIGEVVKGFVEVAQMATLAVEPNNRMLTARNHSTTHLLQKALRDVIGKHVEQAGSSVSADRLRFDFTHFSALTTEEITAVEKIVNDKIKEGLSITVQEMSTDEAKKMGAMALFGEKYGSTVRVVNMGDYSIELCGGTHITNTQQAAIFKIISEAGVAAGVRRIEGVTSEGAFAYYRSAETAIKELCTIVKSEQSQLIHKVENVLQDYKKLQAENEKLKSKLARSSVEDLLNQVEKLGDVDFLCGSMKDLDVNALRDLGDNFKQKLNNAVIVLISSVNDKVNLMVMASDEAVKRGVHAGNIVGEAAKIVGGAGGGRPNMAQAGGKNPENIPEALEKAREVIKIQLKI